jgi:malonyl-CoA O-methyltransferase
MPQLHLLAAADRLVPAEVYPACQALLAATPQAAVRQLPQLCHAAPLCSPRQLATALMDFLAAHNVFSEPGATAAPLEKTDVARSFSRAASTYDAVAALQRRVGDSLLQLAPGPEEGVARLLDLGCGTGHFHAALTERYPDASYYGLDLAAGMVQFARQRSCEPAQWLVADAEALPLAANSVDLVFSSLAIQWCYRLDLLFAELQRVLRPGGRCVFSTLGPGTLTELRQSWAAADAHQHVNEFLPLGQLQQAVAAFPQLQLSIEREVMQVRYPRVRNLFDELKGLGAHNVNTARPAGLSGRRQLSTMMQAYEAFRDADNLLPASYEVYFGTLERR